MDDAILEQALDRISALDLVTARLPRIDRRDAELLLDRRTNSVAGRLPVTRKLTIWRVDTSVFLNL
jgi:hypothetical protein